MRKENGNIQKYTSDQWFRNKEDAKKYMANYVYTQILEKEKKNSSSKSSTTSSSVSESTLITVESSESKNEKNDPNSHESSAIKPINNDDDDDNNNTDIINEKKGLFIDVKCINVLLFYIVFVKNRRTKRKTLDESRTYRGNSA